MRQSIQKLATTFMIVGIISIAESCSAYARQLVIKFAEGATADQFTSKRVAMTDQVNLDDLAKDLGQSANIALFSGDYDKVVLLTTKVVSMKSISPDILAAAFA